MTLNQSKKLLWPVFALMLLAACTQMESFHEDDSLIKDDVSTSASVSTDLIQPLIDKYAVDGRTWYVSKDQIPANTVLKYGPLGVYDPDSEYCGTIESPEFDAWLLVIGDDPCLNGPSFDQLHLFINPDTGAYKEMHVAGMVSGVEWDDSFDKSYEGPSPFSYDFQGQGRAETKAGSSTDGYYAVIINGGWNKDKNYPRYWNDCQYIYQRLTKTLGYNENNIYCLVSDGTSTAGDIPVGAHTYANSPLDFDNDGDNDIQYSATKQNITKVFNLLKSRISSVKHLLVFVTDHGNPGGKICLWNEKEMTAAELKAELNKLPGVKMDIVMGQCYSGAFISPLSASNRTIATACAANEVSYGNNTYDYFLRWWTDAFDPAKASTVDTNHDNLTSLREAFNYAKKEPKAVSGAEHPQYASNPTLYGYTHDLSGGSNPPVITGSDNMKADVQYTYTLTNLPVPATSVTWSCTYELRIVNQTNSTVKVQSTIPSDQYVDYIPNRIYARVMLDGEEFILIKDIRSIWRSGYFFDVNKIIYTADGDYMVYTGYGAHDYQWVCSNSSWTIFPPTGSSHVYITAPANSGPAAVFAIFKNPFGETVTVGQEIQPQNNY